MKTIKFYTLGCKVNQYETQAIREQFACAGYKELENHHPADFYVINTCTVTHRADAESLNLIRRSKRESPRAKIIVTGCLTELDADKIRKIKRNIIIVKNKDKEKICRGISSFKGHTRAFLKIQDGCNNSCSYCKVPLVRGRSRSRPLKEIAAEAKRLAQNGFKEIVLTGICLGAYGSDLKPRKNLVDIINDLEKIPGLLRIRLSSIEAGDISDELIEKMAHSEKLCRHLHIPIQSGDDGILKKMHRSYSRDDYLRLIRRIKKQIPQIGITTDCLVGFPGETEVNFEQTLDLVRKIQPLKAHIFPYSQREGTPAAGFLPPVSPGVIKKRICRIKNIAQACVLKYKKQFLRQKMGVLIECRLKGRPGFWQGYTDNYIKVYLQKHADIQNQLVSAQLKQIAKQAVLADFC